LQAMAYGRASLLVLACCLWLAIPSILEARSLHAEGHDEGEHLFFESSLGFLSQANVLHSEDTPSLDFLEQESSSIENVPFFEEFNSVLQDQNLLSSIPALLNQSGLPIGLLPSSVASYAITTYGDFIVSLEEPCYVDFDYEVYYAQTITGKLSYGTITNLAGIQAKEAFFWLPITAIRTDIPSSGFIYFNIGPISKKLPITQFETIPACKAKAIALL
ncbi:hypothetical protein GOP47_0019316, partial [Adiantum capillus-veneris]